MKLPLLVCVVLAFAPVVFAQNPDDYRGGWKTEANGTPRIYEFSIRGTTVRGVYCTWCNDATTLAFVDGKLRAHLDEYSDANIEFHQSIIKLSKNQVLIDLAANLFLHMRMIRRTTIGEKDRADRSIKDHMAIIEALEARDTERAEDLVRVHALGLAEHVAKFADYLD